jgi:hypothetical protein
MLRSLLILNILIATFLSSCVNTESVDESGFRDLFAVPASFDLNEASRPRAVQRQIPIGSNENQIREFLSRGAGTESDLIELFPVDSTGALVGRIGFDPNAAGIVRTSYVVRFWLGPDRRLDSVNVRKVLTGP